MSAVRGDLYLLTVDVTVCKVTPAIIHVVVSPDSLSRGCLGEWIIIFAETTCVADARDVCGLDARVAD